MQRLGRPRRVAMASLAAVALTAMLAAGCGSSAPKGTAVAPSLAATTIAGTRWDLAAERGHWVVIAFQASTCVPCRKELPEIRAFAEGHPDVRIVSVGLAETPADFAGFLRPFEVTWPAIADRQGYISDRWKVESLPVTVVVDPQGRIAHRFGTGVSVSGLASVVG